MLFISLSENLQREDLGEVEKAEALYKTMSTGRTKLTIREVASKLGIGKSYIEYLLQLHGFPTEVKDMVKSGEVVAKNVRPCSNLDNPQEQIKAAEFIRDKELSYKIE